jgi:membrane protein
MGVLPGQIAFSMILSIVPIITLLGFVASLVGINMDTIINTLNNIIPGGAEALRPILDGSNIDFRLTIIFIWMFYLASNGCNSIILASNTIYGMNQSTWLKRRFKAIFMTIAIILIFLFMLIVPVYGASFVKLFSNTNIYDVIYKAYVILKGPLTWLIMFIFLRAFYNFAPDHVRKNSHINAGAIFTTIGWIILTFIYRQLALNMQNYNLFYGALSSIAFLMIWLYFMSFVFVIGIALNYGEEHDLKTKEETGAVKVIKNR